MAGLDLSSFTYEYTYYKWSSDDDMDTTSGLNEMLKGGWEPVEHVTPSAPSGSGDYSASYNSTKKRFVLVLLRRKKP